MLRIAHADAAAMVGRYPGGAGRGVEEGVEKRPVGNGVGSVLHSLGLAIGAGDRAAVEVVAADDDWRLQLASCHHLVEGEAEPVALAEAHPADPRREALERNALPRHRSEEHTSELQSLMRISYAVFCLKKKN